MKEKREKFPNKLYVVEDYHDNAPFFVSWADLGEIQEEGPVAVYELVESGDMTIRNTFTPGKKK